MLAAVSGKVSLAADLKSAVERRIIVFVNESGLSERPHGCGPERRTGRPRCAVQLSSAPCAVPDAPTPCPVMTLALATGETRDCVPTAPHRPS